MPITPTRVRSPVKPDTGNFAPCRKSIPASMRIVPGGMMSTSSVNNGRCCANAVSVEANTKSIASVLRKYLSAESIVWLRLLLAAIVMAAHGGVNVYASRLFLKNLKRIEIPSRASVYGFAFDRLGINKLEHVHAAFSVPELCQQNVVRA